MDPVSIALGLASIAPSIVRWITGSEKAGEVADKALGVARAISGKPDPQDAVNAILADPAARVAFIAAWKDIEIGLYQSETDRLKEVNQTVRSETASSDPYVRRARSTFLYAMAFTWTVQGGAIAAAIVYCTFIRPEFAEELLAGLKALMGVLAEHWMYALAVTGVAVWTRTADKQTAQGIPGVLGRLTGAFRK